VERFVIAGSRKPAQQETSDCLFDRLVSARVSNDVVSSRPSAFVDHEFGLGRLWHRQVVRFLAAKYAINIRGCASNMSIPSGAPALTITGSE